MKLLPKVIVFDLDGTLYEDIHHFNFYAERLRDKLPLEKQEIFWKEYKLAEQGEHTLRIGRVYDVAKDLVLVQQDGMVKEAFKWDGTALTQEEVHHLYPEQITIDLESMLSIGDLWWVPACVAFHHGLSGESGHQSFLETREFMMTPEFKMNQITDFKEMLQDLREHGVKLVLLTNSPEPDSEVILTKLDLQTVFHKKIFNGKKPTLTSKRFEEIALTFNVKYNVILSVGDNWINEILPAQKLGCSTILIDPHHISTDESADIVVETMTQAIPFFKKIIE
ncbi:HAD hydrolase-like protein [Cytobacillus suaedae]|nr:HAD hydrolase-like protein [Cytobacillus suaedae]